MSILNNVPLSFREPINGNVDAIISAVVPQYADGASIDDVIHFIAGAIRHQSRISINKDGQPLAADKSNSFKAVIEKVEVFDRRGDQNFLVGKKVKIHLKAKNAKGELEDQSIDTEWIEYHAGRSEDETFGIALANTLKKVAEANIGKEVWISKGFITGVTTAMGGTSVRFCANIKPVASQNEEGSSSGSSSSSQSSTPNKPLTTNEDVEDFIADIKDDSETNALFQKLSEKQMKEIPRIILSGLAAGNPTAYLNKALESADLDIDKTEVGKILSGNSKEKDLDLFFLIAESIV